MSNSFTSFLGGVVNGVFGSAGNLKDYQHASRIYVKDTYARAPKFGFLYFVDFNINTDAIPDSGKWKSTYYKHVGLLVKRLDLPKFTLETETVNQYNRKTVIQKAIKYSPVNIELHDDNSEITRDLWKNYFQYYYSDSTYANGLSKNSDVIAQFQDTKYGTADYAYGLNNTQKEPFFKSITIYVMHQHKYSQFTLINPLITEWSHDTLDQGDGGKILANKMNVAYETVLYNQGSIRKGSDSYNFTTFYDNSPSPLGISGNATNTLFGPLGAIAGANSIFGEGGSIERGNYLEAAVQVRNLSKSVSQLNKAGLVSEVTNVVKNALGDIRTEGRRQNVTVSGVSNISQPTTVAEPSKITGR
jgi:hypothetical protein